MPVPSRSLRTQAFRSKRMHSRRLLTPKKFFQSRYRLLAPENLERSLPEDSRTCTPPRHIRENGRPDDRHANGDPVEIVLNVDESIGKDSGECVGENASSESGKHPDYGELHGKDPNDLQPRSPE